MIPQDLNLNRKMRIGESSFQHVQNLLSESRVKRVFEFGSGASSIRLAMALPGAEIISAEHDPIYFWETQALATKYLKGGNLRVLQLPLARRRFGASWYLTYSNPGISGEIDALIIDGPTGRIPRGREACLYALYPHLRINGYVILDDYERRGEREAVARWITTYPRSFELNVVEVGHQVAVLKKVRAIVPRWFGARRLRSDSLSYAKFAWECLPRPLKSVLRPALNEIRRKN